MTNGITYTYTIINHNFIAKHILINRRHSSVNISIEFTQVYLMMFMKV
jgi:hypothetical protein